MHGANACTRLAFYSVMLACHNEEMAGWGSDFCKIAYENQVIIKSTCYES
jgi:hypothetical protein